MSATSEEKIPVIQLSSAPDDRIVFQRRIGQGGFGQVYQGKWKGMELAVKRSRNPTGKKGIIFEVAVLKQLQGLYEV